VRLESESRRSEDEKERARWGERLKASKQIKGRWKGDKVWQEREKSVGLSGVY